MLWAMNSCPGRDIFLLGSGRSVLVLNDAEREYINGSDCRLAVNKFMAFHASSGLRPSHVFFLDDYDESCRRMLRYIFDVCREDGISGLTFVLPPSARRRVFVDGPWASVADAMLLMLKRLAKFIKGDRHPTTPGYTAPRGCRFEFVTHHRWNEGGAWANSLREPLFHFHGSLTSALNYLSVQYPGRRIKLVGVDLDGPDYFFQSELEKVEFEWRDWTSSVTASSGMHFSAQVHEGSTMLDRFDFVVERLRSSGNELYATNPASLLVQRGYVEFKPVLE